MATLFIGLGAMGSLMVANLARGEGLVTVFDVTEDVAQQVAQRTGATVLKSLDTLPKDIDSVILMVPNSTIVEDLLIGETALLDKLPTGSLVIDMSSSVPDSSQALAKKASLHGIDFVDAPVSGGTARAKTGKLAIMAGGETRAVERAKPLLGLLGASIHHVGGPGSGDAAKALNNLLSATNIAAVAEILSAAARFGITPESMLRVINASTSRSQASDFKYPRHVMTGEFDSGFSMDLLLKDLGIAEGLTFAEDLQTPVTDVARSVITSAREYCGDPPDHTEIVRFYEDHNSVLIRNDNDK